MRLFRNSSVLVALLAMAAATRPAHCAPQPRVESFSVDWNVYPGPVAPIDAVARIETILEPPYIRSLPKVDPWGDPFLF